MLSVTDRPDAAVRASPDAGTWADLARSRFSSLREDQLAERAALGLPTDRPVIMTGHQSGFWHPGILSKYIAADRLAKAIGGVSSAIVVDHDVVDPIRIEAVGEAETGEVRPVVVSLRPRSGAATLPRLEPPVTGRELKRWTDPGALLPTDRDEVERIIAALTDCADSESLGEQCARANAELLSPWMRVHQITARQLILSQPWRAFFERVFEEPQACVSAYNAAVASHPEAGIPPLYAVAREYRWELPFWLLDRENGRRPLYEEMVHHRSFNSELLATKALSLTASVRRSLCDLFIHGTGGAIYDRATDTWIRDWLGEELAPSVSMTADLYRDLPLDARRDATEQQLDHALWRAHSARHHPGMLGDAHGESKKRRFLDQINTAPRGSLQRADLYRDMHSMLSSIRESHPDELRALDAHASELRRGLAVNQLEIRRDWSSVLYPASQLDRLSHAIEKALGVTATN